MQVAETAMREVVGKSRWTRPLRDAGRRREPDARPDAADPRPLRHRHPVSTVTLQNVQPPEQVQAAFDDAVKAGQDRERQKNEGQAYANDVIPRRAARRRACSRKPRLQASASSRSAEGDASRFRQVLDRIREGAGRSRASACTSTRCSRSCQLDQQGDGGLPRRRQPALPAARQADAAAQPRAPAADAAAAPRAAARRSRRAGSRARARATRCATATGRDR